MPTFGIGDTVSGPSGSGTVTQIASGDPLIDTDDDSFGEVWLSASNIDSINGQPLGGGGLQGGESLTHSGFTIERNPSNEPNNEYVVSLPGGNVGRYRSLEYAKGVAESFSPSDFPNIDADPSTSGPGYGADAGSNGGGSASGVGIVGIVLAVAGVAYALLGGI